jgi:hypothetical protein
VIQGIPRKSVANVGVNGAPNSGCGMAQAAALRWAVHGYAPWQVQTTLIVAPISAHAGWLKACEENGLGSKIVLLEGTVHERGEQLLRMAGSHEGGIFLTNPESIFTPAGRSDTGKSVPTAIALYSYNAVVWDESTVALSNPQSQTNHVAQRHLAKAPLKLVLSGEYTPEGEWQVFEQMKFVLGSFMGCRNFYNWRNQNFDKWEWEWVAKSPQKIREAVREHAFILDKKAAGLEDERYFEKRACSLPNSIRRSYEDVQRLFGTQLDTEIRCIPCMGKGWRSIGYGIEEICGRCGGQGTISAVETNCAAVVANWLSQIAGGYPKEFPHLKSSHKMKLLREAGDQYRHEPLLVSFRYNAELFAALAQLRRDGFNPEYLTGKVKPERRRIVEQQFREQRINPLLVQAKVARFGLDLSVSDTLFRYSLPYSWEDISQGMNRISHLQKNVPEKKTPLLFINAVCKDTIDEDVLIVAEGKRLTARSFMSSVVRRIRKKL